jgi:hypothetical protein
MFDDATVVQANQSRGERQSQLTPFGLADDAGDAVESNRKCSCKSSFMTWLKTCVTCSWHCGESVGQTCLGAVDTIRTPSRGTRNAPRSRESVWPVDENRPMAKGWSTAAAAAT